ncbi:MAG TPA: hypothetical protein VFC51_10670, partial [Chloroflexota bacterium]|nr:hypothetical protein [Chloroflexota bacterium]
MATITISPNGRNFYEQDSAATELLVGTADGIVVLTRSGPGEEWQEKRRELRGNHIESLVVEPTRGAILAGTGKSGVWASDDGGQTWERRSDGIASERIFALNYVQAGDELRLYAGTEPAELYVSTDLGRHWRHLPALRDVPSVSEWTFPGGDHLAHVKTIAFHPQDPNTIYVGVEVGGAFKSTDAGETWRELNGGGFYVDVHRLMVAPGRPNDVFMSTGRGIYHSVDAGEGWEKLPLPGVEGHDGRSASDGIYYPDGLVMLPQRPEVMFTAGANAAPPYWGKSPGGAHARVARSRDGGRSWEYVSGYPSGRANIEAVTMNVFPGGYGLYVGTTDGEVFMSEDEGDH